MRAHALLPASLRPAATGLLSPLLLMLLLMPLVHAPAHAQGSAGSNAAKCSQVAPVTEQMVVRIMKIPKARLQPGLRLVEDLGASDQRLPALTMQLEDEFLVVLPDELADGSGTTLQAYVDALHKALGCAVRR